MKIDISQLEFIHPTLREILVWIEKKTGLEFTITSLYRINDPGVHGKLPLRGTDLRIRHISTGRTIETLINNEWIYDCHRPHLNCALLHGKGSNLHLHVQVFENTKRR